MTKIISYFFLFFFLLLVNSCSNELTSPFSDSNGKISFSIDKANIPPEVNFIQVKLMKDEFSTITENINFSEDSTQEVLIQEIPIGVWHLKVDALAFDSLLLFTGETNVEILPGETVFINLTLLPVGSDSTGNIHIKINWGTKSWRDYPANPIFTFSKSTTLPNGVIQAKVLKEDDVYKMWYTNLYNSAVTDVGYTESVNGIIWESSTEPPVLTRGNSGQWDSHSVQVGAIIKVDETYRMYYTGMSSEYGQWHVGMATSEDGKNWNKLPAPVLNATENEFQIHVDDVIEIDNNYYMYYTIRSSNYYSNYSIGLATSNDGLNWTRCESNPILIPTSNWENSGVYFPSVINDGNYYKMVYMNSNATAFGFAKSNDGINWEKESSNPFFTEQQTNNNWTSDLAYPFLRKFNNKYHLYYTGSKGGKNSIGLITK